MASPKLRFKEFSGDWTLSELDEHIHESRASSKIQDEYEVLTSSRRGLIRQADYFENSRLTDRENIGFNIIEPDQITYRSRSDDGLFFFNLNGLGITGIISTYYPVFTMKKGNNWFLNELLNYHKYKYIQYAVGTSQLVLSLNQLRKIKFNIPCLDEQTKIASFLSAVDEKISQLTQKHELLSQYKQGMMQKLFSQQIRFKADDGNEFGEWEEKTLNEIASKQSHKNKDDSITEVLTNSATQGIIKQSDYFDREIVTESNLNGYYIVNLNDFVYNPRISVHAPVGPIKRNKKCLGVMSPLYTVFTVKEGDLTYLEYFFDSNFWHDYVKSLANSGARHDRMNITNKDFFDMLILYPCLEEQTKIANFLSSIDQKIDVVAQQIEQTKQWKKGLLQQMFV